MPSPGDGLRSAHAPARKPKILRHLTPQEPTTAPNFTRPNDNLTTKSSPKQTFGTGTSYANGRFVSLQTASLVNGWKVYKPDWKRIKGSFRSQFAGDNVLEATRPSAAFSLAFKGTAVGVYVLAGPDAGILEYSIDGGRFQKVDLFHHYSKGLHYPRTVMFSNELETGKHTLRLRVSADHNEASTGTAARIMQFVAN